MLLGMLSAQKLWRPPPIIQCYASVILRCFVFLLLLSSFFICGTIIITIIIKIMGAYMCDGNTHKHKRRCMRQGGGEAVVIESTCASLAEWSWCRWLCWVHARAIAHSPHARTLKTKHAEQTQQKVCTARDLHAGKRSLVIRRPSAQQTFRCDAMGAGGGGCDDDDDAVGGDQLVPVGVHVRAIIVRCTLCVR